MRRTGHTSSIYALNGLRNDQLSQRLMVSLHSANVLCSHLTKRRRFAASQLVESAARWTTQLLTYLLNLSINQRRHVRHRHGSSSPDIAPLPEHLPAREIPFRTYASSTNVRTFSPLSLSRINVRRRGKRSGAVLLVADVWDCIFWGQVTVGAEAWRGQMSYLRWTGLEPYTSGANGAVALNTCQNKF